jgi:hypothetical protein
MPNPIKEAILNRGWAGKTITRAETVERLNPLIRQFLKLNQNYQSVIRSHSDSAVSEALKRVQKTARADVGKLSETVLSCGGTPENGTNLDAEDVTLADDEFDMLHQLDDLETAFNETIERQLDEVEHQMRTRGILEAVKSNSSERLELVSDLIERAEASTG